MRIGLLDHMGYGNLGDAATQEALIANIRARLPFAEIVGFSLNPQDTTQRHGIPSYSITYWHPGLRSSSTGRGKNHISLRSRLKAVFTRIPIVSGMVRWLLHTSREVKHLVRSLRIVRSLDSLIIAGGGQLSELWRGPRSHPYNVFKFSLLTKLARRKLIFINVGAGPLQHPLSRAFIRWSVNLADYVSFRDVESQALIAELGVRRSTHVFPDSAYGLDVSDIRGVARGSSSGTVVGLNAIGFCDPRIWPEKDLAVYSAYLDKLAEFCLWLWSRHYQVRMYSAELSVDVHALEDLHQRLSASLSPAELDVIFQPPQQTVSGLMAQLAGFDFVVTSKFHGVVFSYLLARPVLAISYHRKIDDLIRTVGENHYCLDIRRFKTTDLEEAFSALVEDAPRLRSKLERISRSYADSLRGQFDSLFVPTGVCFHEAEPKTNEAIVDGPA